ncbi:Septum formation [Curtobacterium sp. 9128]|uniref:septum formation family protein n=1 Tax=Curtobacterium sp. 9128 TaxID=1793722 RepID=UPI0007D72F2F|nr:septum formation family protein [Curtobacterium sp. 9128]SBN62230.1 Septum formation [Curtobacterium sp. 9128]
MTEERPDDAHEPDQTGGPDTGADGQEARPASATDARFTGLRSAADIFGAPRKADEWPSRRERREAERAAAETGAPLPEPFTPEEPVPAEPAPAEPAPAERAPAEPAPATPPASYDENATQAISMPEQLAAPSQPAPPTSDPDRSLLGSRIPPAAAVPPTSTAPHPSSIQLPTAQANREQRAAETRAIEDERRRTDPRGEGRDDVDWLGRATGSTPTPTGPVVQQPVGVENTLPSSQEPPSFTDLLRIQGADASERPSVGRPFDWAVHDDETGEVPTTLTTNSFDTTALGAGSWHLADDTEDDVVSGEVPITPAPAVSAPVAADAATTALPVQETVEPDPDRDPDPTDSGSWSLADEAARTGEVFPGDTVDDAVDDAAPIAPPPLVEPAAPKPRADEYPAHLPPAVEQDLDQSEWDGRETSDTSAIKDLFGTQAVDQLGGTGYDPHDTGTRMMPAMGAPAHAPAPGRAPSAAGSPVPPDADSGNFINEGVARLRGEGKRGKQLLIGGAIAIIVVMLVAVFLLSRWIIGNNIEEKTVPPTKSPAAASAQVTTGSSTKPSAPATAAAAPTITFASSTAAPGQHPWYELAGGECLTPFDSAWAEDFTVVDCGAEHTAQLTARGTIDGDAYPGVEAVKTQAATQCQSAAGLDLTTAARFGDVQVQGVYPPDQAAWDKGDRFWSCFVTRSGGGALTGSLAPSA